MSIRRRLGGAAALALLLGTTPACDGPPPPVEQAAAPAQTEGHDGARRTVVALFDAFSRSDCDALSRTLGEPLRAELGRESCAEALAHEPLRTAALTAIHEVEVDGRDPDALLVTASIIQSGRTRPIVIRVHRGADDYRVIAM